MTYVSSEDSDQPGHPPNLISLRCLPEERLGLYLPRKRSTNILIRLDGSESSLSAQVILMVLLCAGSYKLIGKDHHQTDNRDNPPLLCGDMSLIRRKPVFGGFDHVRLKPVCSATGSSLWLVILDIETRGIILSRKQTTKALIRLCIPTARMRRLICTFVAHIWQKQVFS